MGTSKRQRQKAGRQSRRAEAEAAARKARTRSALLKWGIFAAVVLAIIIGFSVFGGDDDDGSETRTDTTTTAAPATTAAPTATYGTTPCPPAEGVAEPQRTFDASFQQCIDPAKTYTAVLKFNVGELRVALHADKAPITVNNFVALTRSKFYDGLSCHRIIPDFVAQCGDPQGDGRGGPGYRFGDELPAAGEYQIGSLAMANSGPDTNGSQFFVITGDDGAALDPNYSLFGQAEPGQDDVIAALNAAGNDDPGANGVPPKQPITLESVTIIEQ